MSLIIKDKIQNVIPGTPTISDKYDVMTGKASVDMVAGQVVDIDKLFETGEVKTASSSTKRLGVVMHQNIKLENPLEPSPALQTFRKGEIVGICVKGYVTALADKAFDLSTFTSFKLDDKGNLKNDGTIEIPTTNVTVTYSGELVKVLDKKLVEVEIK